MICWSSVPPHPPLCLCQLARLYCNGVPAVDKSVSSAPAAHWQKWKKRWGIPYSLAPLQLIYFLSLTWHMTIWPDLMADYVKCWVYIIILWKKKTICTLIVQANDVQASSINFKQTPGSLNGAIRLINFVTKSRKIKYSLIHTKTLKLLKPGDVEGPCVFSSLFKILYCI